ncbi:pH-response regulator protein palC [Escovopsis weberi]|uniref:pH-response regulator protein palC n=1 Tax=Escovopsis weberi TaxID=150374 RepID=A0A0M8MXQ6_ESCWE|nr:pH-response regulator protein palC [Escovopsis weberi]
MPFPFVLPTTSSFSFSSCFACDSHPSLPLSASTYRGVVRDALKKHKALPAASKASSLNSVVSSLEAYIPYLLAIDAGLCNQVVPVAGPPGSGGGGGAGELVDVILKTTPCMAWRPTVCADAVPGRERARRVKATSLEHEIGFALSALAGARVLTARAALQPLYSTTTEFLGAQERAAAVTAATRHLLAAASVYEYLVERGEQVVGAPPSADVTPATLRALACLALAEATLLAVLKDDPYPAAVAQDRNRNDREWMFRSPEIPKVRAHLFARLCLAASEHAAKASSLCQAAGPGAGSGSGRISPALLRYVEDLRRTSRAKACRFFGIDAELGGETAEGIAWMRAGLQELGAQAKDAKKGPGLSLSRLKKDFEERREDRRVDKETAWGADAGRLEEIRILEMLDAKWNKINDTMNTRPIPPINSLLAKMPSGRDIHTIKPYQPPCLDRDVLESMRAPPEGDDDVFGDEASSDDNDGSRPSAPIGAFPGSAAEYGRSSTPGGSYY